MLMEKECNTIMQPILAAGLPAMGIVWMMARVVVHGPLCYQGLDLPNLYMEQCIARLQTLLQYGLQAKDVTGSLIRYMAEAFRLELGIMGQVFNARVALAPIVTELWIKACWLNMAHHNIHITTNIPNFMVPRAGDSKLMIAFSGQDSVPRNLQCSTGARCTAK